VSGGGEDTMCGRFTLTQPGQLGLRFDVRDEVPQGARYNIAPAQDIPVVRETATGRVLEQRRWGYQPTWAADRGRSAPINARAETLTERPFFRQSLQRRRCLIPADGFYEWQDVGHAPKQPIYFRLRDGAPFGFAGLYAEGSTGSPADDDGGCALITTAPNGLVAPVHDRMPVILRRQDEDLWLDPTVTDMVALRHLMQPYPADLMEAYPVAPLVSSTRNEGARLIELLGYRVACSGEGCVVFPAPLPSRLSRVDTARWDGVG